MMFKSPAKLIFTVLLLLMNFALISKAQSPAVLLTIRGDVERDVKLTANDLAKLTRRTVQVKDHEGRSVKFEGVFLQEVLQLAGVTTGDRLRGDNLRKYLLVDAADAYQVVFALPELDPSFTDKVILLADLRDGKPLAEKEGPLRLVIPDEKKQARWVRQVKTLVVLRAEMIGGGEKK